MFAWKKIKLYFREWWSSQRFFFAGFLLFGVFFTSYVTNNSDVLKPWWTERLCRFRKSGEGTFQSMNITLLLCLLIILLLLILLQSCSQSCLCHSLNIFLSHSDIYFSREGLLGSMSVLLWNHQFISIGCWASFPRANRGQMSCSKINNILSASCSLSTIAKDPAQVTAKFLCTLEQHHPPMKALISSHRQWDHTWVRHHPHPEHLRNLLSDCTATLLPDRLLVHTHASSPHQYSCIDFICLVFIISWIFLTHSCEFVSQPRVCGLRVLRVYTPNRKRMYKLSADSRFILICSPIT